MRASRSPFSTRAPSSKSASSSRPSTRLRTTAVFSEVTVPMARTSTVSRPVSARTVLTATGPSQAAPRWPPGTPLPGERPNSHHRPSTTSRKTSASTQRRRGTPGREGREDSDMKSDQLGSGGPAAGPPLNVLATHGPRRPRKNDNELHFRNARRPRQPRPDNLYNHFIRSRKRRPVQRSGEVVAPSAWIGGPSATRTPATAWATVTPISSHMGSSQSPDRS